MKRLALFSLLIGLLVASVGTISAQTAVDAAAVDSLAAAVAATLGQSSLHVTAQTFSESGSPNGGQGGITQETVQSYDLAAAGDSWNLAGTLTSTSATEMGTMDNTTDVVVLDGVTYMRLTSSGGDNTGISGAFPEGWFTLESLGQTASGPGRFGGFDSSAFVGRALGLLSLPLTTGSVTAISELADDTIDGQAMRVVQVTADSQALLDSAASALLSQGGMMFGGGGRPETGGAPGDGNGAPGAAPDGSTPPANLPDGQNQPGEQGQPPGEAGQMPEGSPGTAPENVRLTFALYIGREDGLVHRIYSVIDQGGGDGAFSQRQTSLAELSAFGTPVTITAPEVSS